jgi:feruloyl esterase
MRALSIRSLVAGSIPDSRGGDQAKFGNSHFSDAVYQGAPWNWRSSDLHRDLALAQSRTLVLDATNPDLRAFRAHGGKLLLFHGWGDAALPPRGTIEYVENVRQFMASHGGQGDVDDFARLFMVPGMGHCWGGPGASSFGNEEVPAPGLIQDADHDIVMALDGWVEHDQPPERIIATRMGKLPMTRPLCVYPKVARYGGKGSSDDAVNFTCVAPP